MTALSDTSKSDHLCLIYDSAQQLVAALAPYFQEGISRGERCLYIGDAPPADEAFAALRRAGLTVLATDQAYLRDGRFEPDRLYSMFREHAEAARRDGFSGLRVAGDASWMLSGAPGTERFFEYESRVTAALREAGVRAFCLYDRRAFPAEHLRSALRTHPRVIHKNAMCDNPHHEPDEVTTHEQIERMLTRMRAASSTHLSPETAFQQQRLEAVGRLAGGVAHEFNNIMTSILGLCRIIEEDLPPASSARDDIRQVLALGVRATDLTSKLLSFAQKRRFQPRRLDLNAAVRGAEPLIRRALGEGPRLSVGAGERPLFVSADPGALEQMLIHLAVNAREALAEGGKVEVRLQATTLSRDGAPAAEYARLSVADTGPGMSPTEQALVFDPFFSAKHPSPSKGLGLSAVYGLMLQCGGFVDIRSAPGRGTDIRLHFPILAP